VIGVLYAAIAAVGDVLGGLLVIGPLSQGERDPRTRRLLLSALVAFGAGFMLAIAFVEMMPAAIGIEGGLTAALIGYLVVHLTQHTITPHFHFGEETHSEAMVARGIGVWALVGLIPHSFFDGVAISSGFLASQSLGVLIFAAVMLHKVPTGASLASIMLASGNTGKNAFIAVVVIAVATVLGAIVTPTLSILAEYGLAISAGVTIYVAASNLIPETQHERSVIIPFGIALGVVVFYLVKMLLPDV
jgi:ZIP family zinc transporter/zinc and cadmium transporter